MSFQTLCVTLDAVGHGSVALDGVPFRDVTGFTIRAQAGELTKVSIDLIALVEFKAPADVKTHVHMISDATLCRGVTYHLAPSWLHRLVYRLAWPCFDCKNCMGDGVYSCFCQSHDAAAPGKGPTRWHLFWRWVWDKRESI